MQGSVFELCCIVFVFFVRTSCSQVNRQHSRLADIGPVQSIKCVYLFSLSNQHCVACIFLEITLFLITQHVSTFNNLSFVCKVFEFLVIKLLCLLPCLWKVLMS